MFGWFIKKPSSGSADSKKESVPPAHEQVPVAPPPQAQPISEPKVSPSVPPPPPPPSAEIPTIPPSSDDWSSLLETEDAAPARPSAPPSSSGKTSSGKIVTSAVPPPAPPGPSSSVLVPGTQMRAIPEKQPSTPRGWNVKILKVDGEGIWIARIPGEDDPLPVSAKEVLTLVIFDERQQLSFDCPVLRIKAGSPEQVLVGQPLKSLQEKSKLDSVGGRQHFRIITSLPIEVKIPGLAGRSIPPLAGHTRDISKGGLAIVVNRNFDIGRELEIRVLSWNFPLQVKAKVLRCDEEPSGMFLVAVAFPDDMSPITRDLVGHFIMENQRGR